MLHYRTHPTAWAEDVPADDRFFIETAWFLRKRSERDRSKRIRQETDKWDSKI